MEPDEIARLGVAALRTRFVEEGRPLSPACEEALRDDPRAGARAVYQAILRRRRENRAEGQRLRHLLRFEVPLWERGVTLIAGVDEAGMAPLAGPVVAAAVVLPRDCRPRGLDDSKQVDSRTSASGWRWRSRRRPSAGRWGWPPSRRSTRLNIYHAGLLAMRRAVRGALALRRAPAHRRPPPARREAAPGRHRPRRRPAASPSPPPASSPRPPATRSWRRSTLEHPGYGFARHKGYPTSEHFEALGRLGACSIHRRSFAPVRQVLGLDPLGPVQAELFPVALPVDLALDGVPRPPGEAAAGRRQRPSN